MLYYGIILTRYDHQTMLKASASVSDHIGVRKVVDVLFATGIGDEIYPIQVDGIPMSDLTPPAMSMKVKFEK